MPCPSYPRSCCGGRCRGSAEAEALQEASTAGTVSAVDERARAHLEYLQQTAQDLQPIGDELTTTQLKAAAAGAIRAMVAVAAMTPDEGREARERLAQVWGAEFAKRTSFIITREGQSGPEDPALRAYVMCRNSPVGHLATIHDVAADENAVAEALAAPHADDRDRIVSAALRGFSERGTSAPIPLDLAGIREDESSR